MEMLNVKDRVLLFAAEYRKWFINAALALVVASVWIAVKAAKAPERATHRKFDETYKAWRASPDEHFDELKLAVENSPSLAKGVLGEIAEWHLVSGRAKEARAAVAEQLVILREAAPEVAEYTEIGFLVAEGQYQLALERSVSLKEKIKEKESALYGQNLLRIAMLHLEVANAAGEWAAWKDVEEFIATSTRALAEIAPLGPQEQAKFETYREERKKQL